jgi:hypothetical protein
MEEEIKISREISYGRSIHISIPLTQSSMNFLSDVLGIKESGNYTVMVYPPGKSQLALETLIIVPSTNS